MESLTESATDTVTENFRIPVNELENMEKTVLKLEHLSHRYSVQWAIRDINFEVKEKGILGLLGSNGAGKSTTMNIMCGVLNQTEGNVFINGIDLRKEPVRAKTFIGFLPQNPPLYPDLTVDEYLTYAAELRSVEPKRIKKAVEACKERCGVAHFSKRLIKNLSGGYKQRIGIAQAIIHNPMFVVLDEPTNGLDPNQIVEIRELIKEIARDRAVMLSTHILSEVQAACDEIKMIEHGELVFSGTMREFDHYIQPDSFIVVLANPPALEVLQQIHGIREVEKLPDASFRMRFETSEEITRKVVELSVVNNWGLSEINIERGSLDEVFARLSGKRDQK